MVNKKTGELVGDFSPVRCRHPQERTRVVTVIAGESQTHQSHLEGCSINNIIKRFDTTGVLPQSRKQGTYADVTGLQGDLTELASKASKVVSSTAEAIKASKAKREKASADRQLELEAEVDRLRKLATPPAGVVNQPAKAAEVPSA